MLFYSGGFWGRQMSARSVETAMAAALTGVAIVEMLGASSALALEKKHPMSPVEMMPVNTWSGCYLSASALGGWQRTTYSNPFFSGNADSSLGGVGAGAGCTYQVSNNWVVGAEFNGSVYSASTSAFIGGTTIRSDPSFSADVIGRIGYLVDPDTMFFAGGGHGWLHSRIAFPASFDDLCLDYWLWELGIERRVSRNVNIGASFTHSSSHKAAAFSDLPVSYETDMARVFVHLELERLFGFIPH